MNLLTAFGSALREVRRNANLTQADLAARAGLHVNFISKLERGGAAPTLETISSLSAALSIKPSRLLACAEVLLEDADVTSDGEPME